MPLRQVLAIDDDIRVQVDRDSAHTYVRFFIRNERDRDDPKDVIDFAAIQITYKDHEPSEISIGAFPPPPGDKSACGYCIGNAATDFDGLKQWLGVIHESESVPWFLYDWVDEQGFEREKNKREPWQLPYEEMELEERAEFRRSWKERKLQEFREAFQGMYLNEPCMDRGMRILDIIEASLLEEERNVPLNEHQLRLLLNDPPARSWGESL